MFYFFFFSSLIFPTSHAMEYDDILVLEESLNFNENDFFLFEQVDSGDDSKVYVTIKQPINKDDDLRLNAVLIVADRIEHPITMEAIKLCSLLDLELNDPTGPLAQFRMSRIFNLENEQCPLSVVTRRLMPYLLPEKLRLRNDLGCGTFTHVVSIDKCYYRSEIGSEICTSLISANTSVQFAAKNCRNYIPKV
ncbi:uncharacterized protein [Prorops nasuta]|uniref:uncharacterized protein n=1 Tax=Prorops nasuta TaxID=863751 RepID=UPI0034CD8314